MCRRTVIEANAFQEIMKDMGNNYRNNDMSTIKHGLCQTINSLDVLFPEEC